MIEALRIGAQSLHQAPTVTPTTTEFSLLGRTKLALLELPETENSLPEGAEADGFLHFVDVLKQSSVNQSVDLCRQLVSDSSAPVIVLLNKFDFENPTFDTVEQMVRLRLGKWENWETHSVLHSSINTFEEMLRALSALVTRLVALAQPIRDEIMLLEESKSLHMILTDWGLPLLERTEGLTDARRYMILKRAFHALRDYKDEILIERLIADPPLWIGIYPLDVPESFPVYLLSIQAKEPLDETLESHGEKISARLSPWLPSFFA